MKWLMKVGATSQLLKLSLFSGALFAVLPNPANAYIGPGAGLGAIAVTIAVVLGVLFLFVGLLWFPLKRLIWGAKGQGDKGSESDAAQ